MVFRFVKEIIGIVTLTKREEYWAKIFLFSNF